MLISDSQSSFVLEKQIIDNILVAYEIMHFEDKEERE